MTMEKETDDIKPTDAVSVEESPAGDLQGVGDADDSKLVRRIDLW